MKKINKKTFLILSAAVSFAVSSAFADEVVQIQDITTNSVVSNEESLSTIANNTEQKHFFNKIKSKLKFTSKKKQAKNASADKGKEILEGTTTIDENSTTDNVATEKMTPEFKADDIITSVVEKDKEKKETEKASIYTNDVHSTFSLEDCIRIAVEYNPEIRSSVYNAQAYQTKIGQAWANYFPKLSLGVNGSRDGVNYSGSSGMYGNSSINNTMGYLPSVSGDMLLFDFGKTKATADSAKKNFEAQKQTTQENINVLVYKLKTTYFNTLYSQAKVHVYQDTVRDYEMQKAQAESFYKIGKKAKIDVITADYNLGKAKLNLLKAENELDVANAELSKVMGIPEYTNFELSSKLETNKFNIKQEEAINKAFDVRPELLSAQKTMQAAKLDLRAKRRSYTPDLGIFASYNNGVGSEYSSYDYKFGVGLNYNELNIAKVKKQIDEATAKYKKSQADYDVKKDEVYLNVKKAYLELKTAEEAIIIAKLSLDEAKEQYRQASGRYKAGVGDVIELKDAESTYLNARLDFYNSLLSYNNSAANLEKEIGVPLIVSSETVLPSTNMEDY